MGTIKHPSGAGSVTPQQEPGKHVRGTDAKNPDTAAKIARASDPGHGSAGRSRRQRPRRATRWLDAAGISKTILGSVRPKEPSPVANFPITRLEPM